MHRLFCSAGFSDALPDDAAAGASMISEGIRTGPAVNDHHDPLARVVVDAAKHFEASLFVVGGWDWRRDDGSLYQRRDANLLEDPGKEHLASQCASILAAWGQTGRPLSSCWIEIGNELDGSYWKRHIDEFHELAMHCYHRVRSVSEDVPFITGSTMNFNKAPWPWQKRGYEIFRDVCSFSWPGDTLQGLHPYRQEGRGWPSFNSEDEVFEELRSLLRGRGLAITEMGWHSGAEHDDDKIADMMTAELDSWSRFGAYCYTHYQIQDSDKPGNTGEGGFGAFSSLGDGFWEKPQARALAGWMSRRNT